MANPAKQSLLQEIRERFGGIRGLPRSQSLFVVGDDAALIYIRYSKVHRDGRAFYGLRQTDLRQLEGHNSFLCFLLDDGSQPLFVPFAEFEEVFRAAQTASDGQYKVMLWPGNDTLELYIAKQGRFNVEAYIGFESITTRLDKRHLRSAASLSHAQVQSLIGGIGHYKGYDVYVPPKDAANLDWDLTPSFPVRGSIPSGFDDVRNILAEIDVIWIASGRNQVMGLFEVEHSTPIYSGLLRFNDVLLSSPEISRYVIVSNDYRRALFARQVYRPTFRMSGLSELTSFIDYVNVLDWHSRLRSVHNNG